MESTEHKAARSALAYESARLKFTSAMNLEVFNLMCANAQNNPRKPRNWIRLVAQWARRNA